MKKLLTVLLSTLIIISGFMINVSAEEPDESKWLISKNKTAIELDENKQSVVTLSLPSSEKIMDTDVVFILDNSSCKSNVEKNLKQNLKKYMSLEDRM